MQKRREIFMIKQLTTIGFLVFSLFISSYTSFAIAHGKTTLEQDECLRGVEGSRVHFSTYQPQHDPSAQYCSEIPETGNTYWVIDLIDSALRHMPIGVRIIKESGEAINNATIYPTRYPDGVIRGESLLDEGQYTVVVTGEGVPPVHYEYPLQVKIGGALSHGQSSFMSLFLVAFLLLGVAWYFNNRSKSNQVSS